MGEVQLLDGEVSEELQKIVHLNSVATIASKRVNVIFSLMFIHQRKSLRSRPTAVVSRKL
jgi:hypothetical protein